MKKRLTIVGMLFLAILVMVGCGKNQQATTKEKETKPEELTLYIVRHGKTMLNTTDRVQGWSDAVLTPEGEKVRNRQHHGGQRSLRVVQEQAACDAAGAGDKIGRASCRERVFWVV